MAKSTSEPDRPKARLPKGLRDIGAEEVRAVEAMLRALRQVYESYGFEPLATPAFEYSDALGKFLPDQDRPNEGVFSFQDDDEAWLSLRYDLTAPLARFVAENYDGLPKPFRRYQTGTVWRNEKPGPGRFREFTQFDADTVGTASVAADAELCMLAADSLEALGIPRGAYVVKVNNRKVLDGVLELIGVDPYDASHMGRRLRVLRAIDKLDRLGPEAVAMLLGKGRKDESGDFTKGAGLSDEQISEVLSFIDIVPVKSSDPNEDRWGKVQSGLDRSNSQEQLRWLDLRLRGSSLGSQGTSELRVIADLVSAAGYSDRVVIDPSVVRGLEYYTGPVFEAELTFEHESEEGTARFGSVGGGGRYDGLIERFKGTRIPATGFSVGVSRLYAALQALGKVGASAGQGPVVVLVMDRERLPDYQRMAMTLRAAGVRAEMYLGSSGMKAQMKYADRRGAPCVVIQGGDERAKGEVTVKDLIEGARLAEQIEDNVAWREGRPAQMSVPEGKLVEAVRDILARHSG